MTDYPDWPIGTEVTVARYGDNVWTIDGPTRHPYNVVVREHRYNTTVHVARSEVTPLGATPLP